MSLSQLALVERIGRAIARHKCGNPERWMLWQEEALAAAAELEIEQQRGDAWRDDFNRDTDLIGDLRSEVGRLQAENAELRARVRELKSATRGMYDLLKGHVCEVCDGGPGNACACACPN